MDVPAFSAAWVVKCAGCGCIITAWAVNPQTEHANPDKVTPPPPDSLQVACSCCWKAYLYKAENIFKASPRPSAACWNRKHPRLEPTTKKVDSHSRAGDGALLIAASLVATIRLRGERFQPNSTVRASVADAIRFVRMIMAEMNK